MRGPAEKVKISKLLFLPKKGFLFMQFFLTRSSMVLFSSFCVANFGQKFDFESFTYGYFWKLLDDMKAIFKPIGLKFGMYIVHTCMIRIFAAISKC